MYRVIFIFCVIITTIMPVYADPSPELTGAMNRVRASCGGISTAMNDMKRMAGINTAVTSVGTLAGGGAIATGFIKQSKDSQATEIEKQLEKLKEIETAQYSNTLTDEQIKQSLAQLRSFNVSHKNDTADQRADLENQLAELNKQSKTLGNWRTGLAAGATVTNIAGAVIAGKNRIGDDLFTKIETCRADIVNLRNVWMQERMNPTNSGIGTDIESIIRECGKWDEVDLSKINTRGTGAMASSITGAGLGTGATIFSAIANTNKIRDANDEAGRSKEKNLNTAANVLSIGTTAASLTATVFNATQIAAIKDAATVADECEKALK